MEHSFPLSILRRVNVKKRREHSKVQTIELLQRIEAGTMGGWEWDDFVGVAQPTAELEQLRKACLKARHDFPAGAMGAWCSPEGMRLIREKARELRGSISASKPEE